MPSTCTTFPRYSRPLYASNTRNGVDRVQMKHRKLKMGLAVALVALGPVAIGILAMKHQQAKMRG